MWLTRTPGRARHPSRPLRELMSLCFVKDFARSPTHAPSNAFALGRPIAATSQVVSRTTRRSRHHPGTSRDARVLHGSDAIRREPIAGLVGRLPRHHHAALAPTAWTTATSRSMSCSVLKRYGDTRMLPSRRLTTTCSWPPARRRGSSCARGRGSTEAPEGAASGGVERAGRLRRPRAAAPEHAIDKPIDCAPSRRAGPTPSTKAAAAAIHGRQVRVERARPLRRVPAPGGRRGLGVGELERAKSPAPLIAIQ